MIIYNNFVLTLLLLCVCVFFHVVPYDGRFGQLKCVAVLNKPNIQDIHSCVCPIIGIKNRLY
jgi:hypothetical protein